ncbi:Dihydroneopterin aldolase-domain-containing protein [Crassisporium funariophilum]|nr:Dihydroneopterin aldolase-domain-containing protein [Crassisporium funariophilum]
MSSEHPRITDVVFVDSLQLSANIGPDCWNRERAQPVDVSVYLHLQGPYLQAAGESDDVLDSIHYGHLTKVITTVVQSKSESDTPGFEGPDALIKAVTAHAFELAGDAAAEVRVVLNIPKMILLATGFSIDVTTIRGLPNDARKKKVYIKDLILPVIIGVNPPEREAKQRVMVNIIFDEDTRLGPSTTVNYPALVSRLSQDIEASSYLTLEKFVMQLVRSACLSSDKIQSVTVRAQKPSALTFAQSSGVEITRWRSMFIS